MLHQSTSDQLPDEFESAAIQLLLPEAEKNSEVSHQRRQQALDLVGAHLPFLTFKGGRLYYKGSDRSGFFIPVAARLTVAQSAHYSPSSGHLGVDKTLSRLQEVAWWPSIVKDVTQMVKSCDICIRSKPRAGVTAPVHPLPVEECFGRVHFDLMGPLPVTANGNRYIFTAIDAATKFIVLHAIRDREAQTVAKALADQVFMPFGFPTKLVLDGAAENTAALQQQLLAHMGVAVHITTPYHPQSNGLIERAHRTINQILRAITDPSQQHWDESLPYVAHAMNTSEASATGYTPFFLMHGRHPRTVVAATVETPAIPKEFPDWYKQMMEARRHAAENDEASRTYDHDPQPTSSAHVGDLVLVKFKKTKRGKSLKLLPVQQGPYKVMALHNDTAQLQHVHQPEDRLKRHVSLLVPYTIPPENMTPELHYDIDVILVRWK